MLKPIRSHCAFSACMEMKFRHTTACFSDFFHNYLTGYRKGRIIQRQIILDEAHDIDEYKTEIKYKLFEAFGQKQQEVLMAEEMQIPLLANILYRQEVSLAAIEIKIRSHYWKPFTPELMKWFTEEYCQESLLPPESPYFYFFLSVVYEEQEPPVAPKKKFALWRKKQAPPPDPNEAIRQTVRKMPGIVLLKELNPITIRHIEDWIETKITREVADKKEIIDRYFSDKRANWDMAEAEKIFRQIIKDYNEGKLL